MKTIFLSLASKELSNNVIFQEKDLNGLNEPWQCLKIELSKIGYEIKTLDNNPLTDFEKILFVNVASLNIDSRNLIDKTKKHLKSILGISKQIKRKTFEECLANDLENKMVLFLWEGKSVNPQNYEYEYHKKFNTILTWKDDLVDNKKYFKFFLPTPTREILRDPIPFDNKKFLVNISANKNTGYPGELYSKRRETIEFFNKRYPGSIDLYGPKWNKPINRWQKYCPFLIKKYNCYRGITYDKMKTLSGYKFSLCYENLDNENGYITEKIFDCLAAKTVPIYLGATNIVDYVDPSTFINRKEFKTDEELAKFITGINENRYNQYLQAGEKYLTSEKYKLFLSENFAKTVINTLKLNNLD